MKKELFAVLIINSDVNKEPRVLKTIEALQAINITPLLISYTGSFKGCICIKYPQVQKNNDHLRYHPIIRKPVSAFIMFQDIVSEKMNNNFFWKDRKFADRILQDIQAYRDNCIMVIAHHLENLAMGSLIAEHLKADLIFNAHEYYPDQFMENERWIKQQKRLVAIGNKYLKKCFKIFTVCNGILKRYKKEFSLKDDQQVLVTNATKYKNLLPSEINSKVRLVHHGVANRNRKLELMIQVSDHVNTDNFEFHFILIPNAYEPDYFNYLKDEINKRTNCFLSDSVPTEKIPDHLNQFDLGFYMYDNSENFNMMHYLPNKLYEFIQARCGVVIGPYVEMEKIVTDYNIGFVTAENSVLEMSKMLNGLSRESVYDFKQNSNKAALELSGEHEIKKMQHIFNEIKNKRVD